MEEILNLWGLEYSISQNFFSSLPIYEILIRNKASLEMGEQHDFILIDIFKSKKELEDFVDIWIEKMKSNIIYNDIYGTVRIKNKN